MQSLYYLLVFFTPLIYTLNTSELFELPKMYFVYTLTLLILLAHLVSLLRSQAPRWRSHKLLLPLGLFYLSQLVSTFFSVDSYTSIFGYYSRLNGGLLSLTTYIILFLILSQYINPKFKQKIIYYTLFSGILAAIYGILQHFGIDKDQWLQDVQTRVFSTLGQPNWLAAYLCILLPLSINQSFKSKKILHSSLWFLVSSLLFLCLLFTKSKSGLVAAAISLTIYFIYKFFNKRSSIYYLSIYLLIFITLSLTISNPIKEIVFPQKNSPSTTQTTILNITPSEDIRRIVWQGSFDLWKRFPLFGTGPETFAYTYYWTRPASHNLTSEWDFLYNKAHNEYLNYLATTGIFGLASYLFLIAYFLYYLRKKPALLAAFISILITNFAGFSVVVTALFFFLLPALARPRKSLLLSPKKPNYALLIIPIPVLLFLFYKNITFFLADVYYNYADKNLSQNAITRSLNYRPNEAIYWNLAAKIYLQNHDVDRAVAASNQSISLSPASTNIWKERAQLFAQIAVNDPPAFIHSLEALETAAKLAPTDAKTFYLLGRFYEAAGDIDTATKNYQKALSLKANDDYSAYSLGKIYYDQKNYTQAKIYFETVLRYAPNNTDAKEYIDNINLKK